MMILTLFLASAGALVALCRGVEADDLKDTLPKPAPKDVEMLFDGTDLSKWVKYDPKQKGDVFRPAKWKVVKGYLEVVPGERDIMTKKRYGPDFQLHVEFWLPLMADKKGQRRADSGVFLQGRYEIQVLDSYQRDEDGTALVYTCGALYGLIPPSKNVCRPPQEWQTFDITFHAPRFDESKGRVVKKGELTVVHNGETVINKAAFDKVTAGAMDTKLGKDGPIRLQDHEAKVRFRNIWIKPLLPVR
jgi:hypothetical protein